MEPIVSIVEQTYGGSGLPGQYSHASSGMEVSDGGGFIHLDFYRRVRQLTDSWGPEAELAYMNVITGNATNEDVGVLAPLKPQVVAQALEDGIDIRIGNNEPVIVLDGDTFYNVDILKIYRECNKKNAVVCFKQADENPIYSYIKFDEDNKILEIAEKKKISPYANTGTYAFLNLHQLKKYCKHIIKFPFVFRIQSTLQLFERVF